MAHRSRSPSTRRARRRRCSRFARPTSRSARSRTSDIAATPPAGAKIVDLSSQTNDDGTGGSSTPAVTGLAAVQAAAPFAVDRAGHAGRPPAARHPARRPVGLARGPRRLRPGPRGDRRRRAGRGRVRARSQSGGLSSLPTVSLDGVTAHELSTQLGTILSWDKGGVSYVLAGSVPAAAAESAARALK